jgi:hypothetical protein
MKIERFENIEAWQLAQDLTRKVNGRKVTLNPEPVNAYKMWNGDLHGDRLSG